MTEEAGDDFEVGAGLLAEHGGSMTKRVDGDADGVNAGVIATCNLKFNPILPDG